MTAAGVFAVMVVGGSALAQPADQQRAKDEVDRQLQQMVGKTPTRVRVDFVSLDDPNYVLEDALFELDGLRVASPSPQALNGEGTVPVWSGDAAPGKHELAVHLVYANKASVVVSDEGGYKWRIAASVWFELFKGIEVQVKVTPARVPNQRDISKRFKLTLPATPVMLAKLDDGKMPEPMKKVEVDAGTQVAAVDPKVLAKQEAEAKKAAAAEEKKAKAEAARLAKEEAAAKAKEAAAARLEARRQAAEDKKRAAEEAKLAANEAAERRKHPELAVAAAPVVDAGVALAEAPDAGAAEAVAEVDAGAAVAVAEPPDAGAQKVAAATGTSGEGGMPWLPIAAGVGALVILLIFIARRRASVPKIN